MTTINSALNVEIKTGDAAAQLLQLKSGLEGAALGVAKLGREIQNHAGNIQRVLGELSKMGFGGLSQSLSNETKQVGAGMRQLEREVVAAAEKTGKRAGKSMSRGIAEEAEQGTAYVHKVMLRSAEMTGKLQLSEAAKTLREKVAANKTAAAEEVAAVKASDAEKLHSNKLHHKVSVLELREKVAATKETLRQEVIESKKADAEKLHSNKLHHKVSVLELREKLAAAKFTMREEVVESKKADAEKLHSNKLHHRVSVLELREKVAAHNAAVKEEAAAVKAAEDEKMHWIKLNHKMAVVELRERLNKEKALQAAAATQAATRQAQFGTIGGYQVNRSALPMMNVAAMNDATAALNRQRDAAVGIKPAIDNSKVAMQQWSHEAKLLHDSARGAAAGVGYLWMTWGNIGAMAAGFAAVRGMTSALKEMAEVEVLLTKASREGGMEFEQMRTKMMSMYTNGVMPMMVGPKEVAQQLKDLVYAGFTASEAFDMLGTSLKFAAVGELEADEAAQVLQQTIHAFGLTGKDAGRVADVMAKAAAASATDVGAMASAMRQAVTVGALYNASVEDTATSLAVLAKAGIEGSAAGTSLKRFMDELASPKTNKAREAIKALGVQVFEFKNGVNQLKPLAAIVDEMRNKFQALSKVDAQGFFKLVDSMQDERGKKFFSLAVKMDQTEWDEFKKTVDTDSAGFVDSMYNALSATTKGLFKQVAVQLKASMQEALRGIDEPLKNLGQSLLTLVTSTGFKEFLSSSVTLLGYLTQLLVDHGKTILMVVAVYKGFQVAYGVLNLATVGVLGLVKATQTVYYVTKLATAGQLAFLAGTRGVTGAIGDLALGHRGLLMSLTGIARFIPYIGGLLAVGMIAWSLWGDSAEKAAKKAKKAMDDQASSSQNLIDRINSQRAAQNMGVNGSLMQEIGDEVKKELALMQDLKAQYKTNLGGRMSSDAQKEYDLHEKKVKDLGTLYGKLKAESAAGAVAPTPVNTPSIPDPDVSTTTAPLLKAKYSEELKLYRDHLSAIDSVERDALVLSKANKEAGLSTEQDYLSERVAIRAAADADAKRQLDTYVSAQRAASDTALGEKRKQIAEAKSLGLMKDAATINKITEATNRSVEALAKADVATEQYIARSAQRASAEKLDALASMREKFGNPEDDIAKAREVTDELLAQNEATRSLTEVNRDKNIEAMEGSVRNVEGLITEAWAQAEVIGLTYEGIEALEAKKAVLISTLNDYKLGIQAQIAMESDWMLGARQGMRDYYEDIAKVGNATRDAVKNAFNGMEDALVEFVKTGKLDFKSLAESIITDMIRIQVQQSFMPMLKTGVSFLMSAAGFAQGDAFTGAAGLSAYSNSIVSKPTLFPFAQGGAVGLMGEKPGSPGEAILPLTRMSGGDLGVKASGGGGETVVNSTINVSIASDGSTKVDRKGADDIGRKIESAVVGVIMRELRPGGMLQGAN